MKAALWLLILCVYKGLESIHSFNYTEVADEWSHLDELFMKSLLWGPYGNGSRV